MARLMKGGGIIHSLFSFEDGILPLIIAIAFVIGLFFYLFL
jgi:hypothetical protein